MGKAELVLIASKDARLRLKLAGACKKIGVDAHKARTWAEAQACMRNRYYDIIVLDAALPGAPCTEKIKAIRGMGLDSCIVVSSPFANTAGVVACLRGGAYDVILQPVDEQWAAIQITRAFERRRYYDLSQHTDQYWQLAVFDELTRVHNHRYFHLALEKAVMAARRYHYPLSLLVIDIDNFRKYNERHGHLAGDEVLRALGAYLARTVRASDQVARYGGEEFMVTLPHTNREGAVALGERLRSEFAAMRFMPRGPVSPLRLTISVGAAAMPQDARSKDEMLKKAEAALGKAKRKGKNRVCG